MSIKYFMEPHFLICPITGKSRKTTIKYLQGIAKKHSMTVEQYKDHYMCRDAAVLLNNGLTIEEIRGKVPNAPQVTIAPEKLDKMRKIHVPTQKVAKLLDNKVTRKI